MTDIFTDTDESKNANQLTAIRIKEERNRLKFSQQSVADHLGMDISNYSRLENGKVEITIGKLEAISKLFKTPVASLLPDQLPSTINITKMEHSCIGTLINNYTDQELQKTLKLVVELLQKEVH